jgi:hypothetical protein
MTIRMARKNLEKDPHCLSRGFINFNTKELGSLSGYYVRRKAMGILIRAPDYGVNIAQCYIGA